MSGHSGFADRPIGSDPGQAQFGQAEVQAGAPQRIWN